jgi:hypothetical protein
MSRPSVTWRRVARTTLRLSLHGTGWLLTSSGRFLQSSGELLTSVGATLNPTPQDPRRK